MVKHQRGAVTAVMNMSLFLLLLLSGLFFRTSDSQRKYFYINKNMTWTDAQSYCRERYTDLATVDSMDDVNRMIFLTNGYRGSVWIGLQGVNQTSWVWSNGENTLSQYSTWYSPPVDELTSSCGLSYNGNWYTRQCYRRLHFVCYNETTKYILFSVMKTWMESQSYCRQYYTDLATVRSARENSELLAIVGSAPSVWIGLFLDSWQWSDQCNFTFRNWVAGPPLQSSGTGDCVVMSGVTGKWVNSSCNVTYPFFCYDDVKVQTVRLIFSFDDKYNLNDPSLQTAILNQISEKLKSAGLQNRSTISWLMDEGGEVFHLESKPKTISKDVCDKN
ncbi:macrophage mannose receptor 1-like isoform X1 [Misgurnus anguillicaudatus]|uniref:macrophage mannose receptor 1-like isoform X1 n=1 Tax=Misgurnus anguillicaudatus TaxID=75329 RepID=UPI003CCF266E